MFEGQLFFLFNIMVIFIAIVFGYDDETPLCFAKYDGVCSFKYDRCPFEKSIEVQGMINETICHKEYQKCCKPVKMSERPEKRNKMCGISKGSKFKVFGGWRSMPGEWPWQAQIEFNGLHHCGGAIFHPNWVITAAHCFILDSDPDKFRVRAGKTQLNITEKFEQSRQVKKIIKHERFNIISKSDDIALLQMREPFYFDYKYVAPICMPNPDEQFDNNICTLTGYGKIEESDYDSSNFLLEVNLPIVNETACSEKHCGLETVYKENICAGFKEGHRDACGGDSGGPIVCEKISANGNKQFVLAGVVSHSTGCGYKDIPGIYTRITSYLDWIESQSGVVVIGGSLTGSTKFILKKPIAVVPKKCKTETKI